MDEKKSENPKAEEPLPAKSTDEAVQVEEVGGPKGPDPTRFGDWSVNGRCIDF